MANIAINIAENGTTTLATAGKYCDRNIDVVVEVAGSGGVEVEPIVLSHDCQYACSGAIASVYIKNFGDTITTYWIHKADKMFFNSKLERIPFDINFNPTGSTTHANMFEAAEQLKEIPNMYKARPTSLNLMFSGCRRVRYLPENLGEDWTWESLRNSAYNNISSIFKDCYSLREIPEYFLSQLWGTQTTSYTAANNCFSGCYTLDEVNNFPIQQGKQTSNMFNSTFYQCCRLKGFTFATNEDGTPKIAEWKSQTIDLINYIGYSSNNSYILQYNSGITADKEVKDDATYQALKNDVDWYTANVNYSRYNHDSAVNTINSLPDTSAYLASAGGTNTIKFKGAAGSLTDGGAINTLTEEEIAVAAAKGWTVTLS